MKSIEPIIVAISGGFDPLHVGHIRLFKAAKALGNQLVVIVNNDHWLMKKKGYVFIKEQERCEIIAAIRDVDQVILTKHAENPEDMSVCEVLKLVKPHIFANGGDRHFHNIPEIDVCRELGCALVFNCGEGGKVQSSSWLLEKFLAKRKSLPSVEQVM